MADLNTLLAKFLAALGSGTPKVVFGSGQTEGSVSGVLTVSTTQAATIADTNETTLWSYSLPANTLSANNKGLHIYAVGTYAANGNAKTVRLKFGSTNVNGTGGSPNGGAWRIDAYIYRTGASAQLATGEHGSNTIGYGNLQLTTPAEDTTGAITIAVSGQNGTASASDIVFRSVVVRVLN